MEIFLTGACLRNWDDGNGWQPMSTLGHQPLNVGSVVTTTEYIEVNHSLYGDICVTTFATVDNNMAAGHYMVGISGGKTRSLIYIYKGTNLINPWDVNMTTVHNSNIWYGTMQGVIEQ